MMKFKGEILEAQDAASVISPIKFKGDHAQSIVKKIRRLIWTEEDEWNQWFKEAGKVKFDEKSVKHLLCSYDIATRQFKKIL